MAMWNQSGSEENKSSAAPVAAPQVATVAAESVRPQRGESVFGAGVTIEGKIEGDADVRIGGKFKGDIQVKGNLTIEKGAQLTAKINAANVTIGGQVEGNVVASAQVKLLESGQLVGDLKASTLTVAAGSRMRGHVEFGWSSMEPAKFVNGEAHASEKKRSEG